VLHQPSSSPSSHGPQAERAGFALQWCIPTTHPDHEELKGWDLANFNGNAKTYEAGNDPDPFRGGDELVKGTPLRLEGQ
jgi:hypothetical protein